MRSLNNNIIYFNSFGVKHIPKEIKAFIDKSINITNIFRIQAYHWIMSEYFCFGFYACKEDLADFTNLFEPNNFKKNDDIILKYFMTNI